MNEKIQVQAGGKLYIAGEYAVLTPGQSAIIKNIPIYMNAEIKLAQSISIWSDMFNYSTDMSKDSNYALIQDTIAAFAEFLGKKVSDLQPFTLEIRGKLEEKGKKYGIGSSGSVTVLTLKALLAFYHLHLSKDTIFKLASYVLIKRGDNGSMGDLACIIYDDLVYFTSFDRDLIRKWIASETLEKLLKREWGYEIFVLKTDINCDFLVGWTKQPSISKDMIDYVKTAISQKFLIQTQNHLNCLKTAFLAADKKTIKKELEAVSDLLLNLSPVIYNEKLLQLKRASYGLDIVAKSSGSGGGDCGIALSFNEKDSQTIIERWQEAGIELLYQEKL